MIFDSYALPVIEAPVQPAGEWRFRAEAALGTRMNLIVRAETGDCALAAARAARAEVDRLDLIFNSRARGSELVALNAACAFAASPELFAALAAAEGWREATGGAFSPRLGHVLHAWREARDRTPPQEAVADLAAAAKAAKVTLDSSSRLILRPPEVSFALDGFAKGWIVDAALKATLATRGITGALVDIGGDIACGGSAPDRGWQIGIPDPLLPFDNAPLVSCVALAHGAVATSGRGPRDRLIDGTRHGQTLSASVVAQCAADADALATASLVLPHASTLDLLARRRGAGVRLTAPDGAAITAGVWDKMQQPEFLRVQATGPWPKGWQALATFTAPRRQLLRDPDFRSPYMAMWITDTHNKPVRTLILVGKRAEWQRDNYIWQQQNRDAASRLMATRSMSTSGAGVYNVFWDGVDDTGRAVKPGAFILHVETSRERGKHTYRQLTLDFSQARRFAETLAPTEEGGGLAVTYDHY